MAEPALHIEDEGTGPSIIFTHGWADDSSVWTGEVEGLADRARVLTWDLRGHGRSDAAPPGRYGRRYALDDLARVVQRAERPCILAGHSLGGYLALAYALEHPDDVRGLVLIAAGPGFRNPDARDQWNASVHASAAKMDLPEGQEEISLHVDSWVIDNLAEITAPALVIVGEHDKRFQASASVFEKYLDVRATVIVPDAGHSVHRKHPEAVNAAIHKFLDELES